MIQFKGFSITQGDFKFYVGKMEVKDLLKFIPEMWSRDNKEGYQRDLSDRRAKDYASFIRNNGASPLSILLSVRQGDMVLSDDADGIVLVDDDAPKFIVDGQHRRRGLEILVDENPDKFESYEVPVILMNPEDRYNEAKQFLIINRTQKGIRPDLAERILQQMIKTEGREALITQREEHGVLRNLLKNVEWNTKALDVADILNRGSLDDGTPIDSPWKVQIWLPNEPRGGRSISQKAFTDSLDPIVKAEFLAAETAEFLAKVVANYWKALADLISQAFDNPAEYGIQKTSGAVVMNGLLTEVARYSQDATGRKDLRTPAFKTVLEGLGKARLEPGFWQSGGGAFSMRAGNRAGQAFLLQEFKEALNESMSTTKLTSDLLV